jgi:hypothetical protein
MCDPVGVPRFLANLLPTALALVRDIFRFIKNVPCNGHAVRVG